MTPQTGDLFGHHPPDPVVEQRRSDLLHYQQAHQYHRQGNPWQRHIARIEQDKATELLHQLGGLLATW